MVDEDGSLLTEDDVESEKEELSETLSPTIPSTKKPLAGRKRSESPSVTSTASAVMSSALDYLNEKKKKGSDRFDDAEKVFGQHVASSLRSMKDEGTVEYAKLKIQQILFECRMGNQYLSNNVYLPQMTPVDYSPNANRITQATLLSSQRSMYNPATTNPKSPMY